MTEVNDSLIYKSRYKFLLISALSAFIATLDASIVNISLPTLANQFEVDIDLVAWIVLSYSLTISATLLLAGRIAVKRGYRFIYLAGFGFFTLGSLLCGLSGSLWMLIGARIVQGIGASFLMSSGPALVTRAFPANERGRSMGVIGTIVGVGLMSGPPLGGFLVSSFGWPVIFYINIPVGIFGLLYAGKLLKSIEPDNSASKVDYRGGGFQAIGIIFLLMFFNRVNSPGWDDSILFSMLAVALVSLGFFLYRETHTDQPLLGFAIFRYRQFSIALSSMLIIFTCVATGMVLIPFFLQNILHLEPLDIGLVLITIPICTMIIAPVAGRVSDAIGYKLLTILGSLLFIIGMFWISELNQSATRWDIVMRLAVIGIGVGLFQAPNASSMMSAVPKRLIGVASGLMGLARNLGITGGVALSTAILMYRKGMLIGDLGEAGSFVAAFSWVVKLFSVVAIGALILALIRKNRIEEVPQ